MVEWAATFVHETVQSTVELVPLSSRDACLAPVSSRVVCLVMKCLLMIETWTQLSKLIKEARESEALGYISWHFKLCSIINKNTSQLLWCYVPWNKQSVQMGDIRDFCGKCGRTCAKRHCVQNALVFPGISAGYVAILLFDRHAVLSDILNATTNLPLLHLLTLQMYLYTELNPLKTVC